MSKWIFKTLLQRAISWFPQSHKINALFQEYVTKGLHVKISSFETKVSDCRAHLEYYYSFSPAPKTSFRVLELGTGWWPIIPIGLYLCGAEEIWTYDIVRLLRKDTFQRVLKLYLEYYQDGRLAKMLPRLRADRASRLSELVTRSATEEPVDIFESLKIHALIRDACHTELPAESVDLVYSNFCFEHLPFDLQKALHAEFKRVGAKDSVASHYVGIGDQFANFDSSITYLNHLKYTARQWRILDNPIIPQTRLRACDYRRAFEESGYEVVAQRNTLATKEDLAKITVAPEFRHYSEEDLLTVFAWFVGRPR